MKKALIGIAVLLGAAVVWVAMPRNAGGPPPPTARAAGPSAPDEHRDAAPAGQPAREHRGVELAAASGEFVATLRGRCVGEAGAPVAGCAVTVWEGDRPRRATTGGDGVFAFALAPGRAQQLVIEIRAPAGAPLRARTGGLAPGDVRDFGDVEMRSGSAVRGRVVSSDGRPQRDVLVQLAARVPPPDQRGPFAFPDRYEARSGADGAFALTEPLACGTWDLTLHGRAKLAPDFVRIPAGQPTTVVEIRTKTAADIGAIRGVLVDQAGAPVAGAEVAADSRTPPVVTGPDGAFCLRPAEDTRDVPVLIRFRHPDCEPLQSPERCAWGISGLRFVAQRLLAVDVIVTDAETGGPIEDFIVREKSIWLPRPRSQGRLTMYLPVGSHAITVEPRSEDWQSSEPLPLEVTAAGAPPLLVRLGRTATRTLRVRTADGQPVAGTGVELIRPLDGSEVLVDTRMTGKNAAPVTEGATDAEGEIVLRGPASVALSLRLRGAEHAPMVRHGVVLATGADPLTVVVSAGATVRGKIGPAHLLATLRREELARYGQYGPMLTFARSRSGEDPRQLFLHAPIQRVALGEDGTFEARHLPPGTWDAYLLYWKSGTRDGLPPGRWDQRSVFVGSLPDLADGEIRPLLVTLDDPLPEEPRGKRH